MITGLDQARLDYVAKKVLDNWGSLAVWLQLTTDDIEHLKSKSDYESYERCQGVLQIWSKRKPADCDLLGELANTLKEHDEYKAVADKLVQGIHLAKFLLV